MMCFVISQEGVAVVLIVISQLEGLLNQQSSYYWGFARKLILLRGEYQ